MKKIETYLSEAKIAETPEEAFQMFLASSLFKKYFKKGWTVGRLETDRYQSDVKSVNITVTGSHEESIKNRSKPESKRFSAASKKLYAPMTMNLFVSEVYKFFENIGWPQHGKKMFSLGGEDYLDLSVHLSFWTSAK